MKRSFSLSTSVRRLLAVCLTGLLIIQLILPVQSARAGSPTVCTVTTASDGTSPIPTGSLREKIADTTCDSIVFDGDYTIKLGSTLGIGRALTIDGSGHTVTVSGEGSVRVFFINTGTVSLKALAITNGRVDLGAGIYNLEGSLTVQNSTITGNQATDEGGGLYNDFSGNARVVDSMFSNNSANYGGGIDNGGTMTITGSTLTGNSAGTGGGGILNKFRLTVADSTVQGNTVTSYDYYGQGGGLYNSNASIMTLINNTIAGNYARMNGGGVYNDSSGTLSLTNNIISGSTHGEDCYNVGTISKNLDNLVQDDTCSGAYDGDPMLDALANNGGPTQTMALLPGSPAIDAGDDATCAAAPVNGKDQRGETRTSSTSKCDIGAYEVQLPSCQPAITVKNANDSGSESLRQAILDVCDGGTITFDSDYNIVLAGSLPTLDKNLTIDGENNDVSVSGNLLYGIIAILPDTTVHLKSLTVLYGMGDYGGAINNSGTLYIDGVNFNHNHSPSHDGGAIYNTGTLYLTGSSLESNDAYGSGGGIYSTGELHVQNSTFYQNTAAQNGGGILTTGTGDVKGSTFDTNTATSGGGGGIYTFGTLDVSNSTFYGNHGSYAGGIFNYGTLTIESSTMAGNTASGPGVDIINGSGSTTVTNSILDPAALSNCSGTIVDGGHNIDMGNSCGFTASGSLVNTDPKLGPLQFNGGPTQTMALLPGSPAIDSGDDATCAAAPVNALDQRGVTRPTACDIGAFESQGFTLTKTGGDNQSTLVSTAFTNPLTLTVTSNYSEPVDGGVVTFTAPSSGASTDPAVNTATISGGSASQSVTANGTAGGPYNVTASASGAASVNFSLTNTPACQSAITVTSDDDSSPGTLRQAILDICPGGTISFDNDSAIILGSALPDLDQDMTITGSGHDVILDGHSRNRAFHILQGASVTLDTLTIENCRSTDEKGAIFNEGTLVLKNSTLTKNLAHSNNTYSVGIGGGITSAPNSTLKVINSNIFGNAAFTYGGGIYISYGILEVTNSIISQNISKYGAGIYAERSNVTITASTFDNNTVIYDGGGIYSHANNTAVVTNSTFYHNTTNNIYYGAGIYHLGGPLTVTNSTFSGDQASTGVAIYSYSGGVTLTNTIVDDGTSACYSGSAITDGGGNLDSDNSCGFSTANGSLVDTSPLLSPLADNGGPTQTVALLPGSPAIDAGQDSTCPATDQRDWGRVGACDIGAFESQGFTFNNQTGDSQSTTVNTAFANPLGLTVTANNPPEPVDGGLVTFSAPSSGASTNPAINTATISGGAVSQNVTANGTTGGPYTVTASASGAANVSFSLTNTPPCQSAITVTDSGNSGPGTLRQAIIDLCPGGTITFDGDHSISLTSGMLGLTRDLTIDGGMNHIHVSGTLRVFAGVKANLNALDISAFNQNYGAIINEGILNITNSTFYGNWARYMGGAIFNSGNLNVTNSTFVGNISKQQGGAIYNTSAGILQVTNSTFVSNQATMQGGTIYNASGNVILTNTIILPGSTGSSCIGTITDGGGNLVWGDTTCPGTSADPLLGQFIDNGGPTQTMALLPGSPAIDAVDASACPATDQRGVTRPQGARCDIGAFEQRTCTVTTAADSGPGSLREKIADLTCSIINFAGSYTITLGSLLPDLDRDLVIDGSGHSIWVDGNDQFRVFTVNPAHQIDVTLKALTVADGRADLGGGIDLEWGNLTLSQVTLYHNIATLVGGGIFNDGGGLQIMDSTFSQNSAPDGGGGAIYGNNGDLQITNSTFADNSAYSGGAIFDQNSVSLTNSTLTGNTASSGQGGGIDNEGVADLKNTLLAGNTGGNCFGTINDQGGNLVWGDTTCPGTSADPRLGPLQDNGGPTQTMALLAGSPAIDAGDAGSAPATDQRGVSRPQGAGVDIGAFEFRTCTVTTDADGTAPIPAGSLREKISDRTCSVINFDADHTITLGSALPDLGLGLTIDGGSHHVTVDGGGIVTVFTIPQFADVALNALTITHGHNQGIANYAQLTITNSTITNNSSDIDGGGILNEGTLTVTNSTIANNSAGTDGGGIYNASGQLTLLNNTLAGNSAGQHGADLSNETTRGGSLYLDNNIIAGSTFTDCYTTVKSKNLTFGNNLIQHGCASSNRGDPKLGPLQDNGGPTSTMALLAGSPAIDALDPSTCPATDQRGISRPQGALCDMGAYETTSSTTVVTFEPGPYTYRGTAFTATAVVTGAGGLNQAVPVSYSDDCTHVSTGGCTASATFPGDATHAGSSDSRNITILPVALSVTPDAKTLTYADPIPAASFYKFIVTGWVHGEGPASALAYTAPTCGSAYTSTSPASPPALTIDCGGNPDGAAGLASDYTFDYHTAALTINKAASSTVVTFEAGPYTYRGTAFTATAHVTGAGGLSQNLPVAYKGDCKNVTVTNGCTASASYGGDANHTASSDSKSITITKATLTVTADNQAAQYSDASPALTFKYSGFVNGEGPANLTKQPTCTTTRTVNSPAGAYDITCSGGTATNYAFSYQKGSFTVLPEDAYMEYSGDSIAQVNMNLTLRATVWDSAAASYPSTSPNPESKPKATIGDVTKMWVQFNIYPEASCGTPGTTVAVLYAQVTDAPTLKDGIGTASLTWKSTTEASYCVIASLVGDKTGATNQYYTAANAPSAGILFYQNSGKFAAGGGWIKDPGGLPGSFSLVARYDSKGNPFGQMVYVYRGMYNGIPAMFAIRSNSLTGLSISGTSYPLTAALQGKCTIWVMRAFGGAPLFSDFNATCKATTVDTNKTPVPGGDTFALTVWDKNGVIYKTVPVSSLTIGNVVIHLK